MAGKITTTVKVTKSPKNGVTKAEIDLMDVNAKKEAYKVANGSYPTDLQLVFPAGIKTLGLTIVLS